MNSTPEFRHAIVAVLLHDLVDLLPQLVGNFRLFGSARHLLQQAQHVHIAARRPARLGVRDVQIVQRHVLDDR